MKKFLVLLILVVAGCYGSPTHTRTGGKSGYMTCDVSGCFSQVCYYESSSRICKNYSGPDCTTGFGLVWENLFFKDASVSLEDEHSLLITSDFEIQYNQTYCHIDIPVFDDRNCTNRRDYWYYMVENGTLFIDTPPSGVKVVMDYKRKNIKLYVSHQTPPSPDEIRCCHINRNLNLTLNEMYSELEDLYNFKARCPIEQFDDKFSSVVKKKLDVRIDYLLENMVQRGFEE